MIKNQEKLIALLVALFPECKIYLFGSRARGDYSVTSDVDIAIDIGRKMTSEELAQALNVIDALNIPQKIDLVDLYAVPEDMKKVVLREALVWRK